MRRDHRGAVGLAHRQRHSVGERLALDLPADPAGERADRDREQRPEQEEEERAAEQDGVEIAPRDDARSLEQ